MEVFLWLTWLDRWRSAGPARLVRAEALLDGRERERAAGYRFEAHRSRFVIARAFLRTVLGRHLGLPPDAVAFHEPPGEKPRLQRRGAAARLDFSLSRSGGVVLCGVVRGRRLGVDVERVRMLPDLAGVAATIMTTGELARWRDERAPARLADFYALWTRKEALVKADGRGLSAGPRTLAVPFDLPADHAVTVDGAAPDERWLMTDLVVDADVAGCVVVEQLPGEAAFERHQDARFGAGEHPADHPDLHVPPEAALIVRRFVATPSPA